MIRKQWLLTTGDDNRQHVLYRPERNRHTLTADCPCGTREEASVIIHRVLTWIPPRPMQGRQLEH